MSTISGSSNDEQRLPGGSVNVVLKIGETVRRPVGPWTPAVHALLRHLERVGFDGAPRVLGIDEAGREILTFIPGKVATRPWPAELRTDSGIGSLARLARRYHDAVAGFIPPIDAIWRVTRRVAKAHPQAGQIVCHGDLCPWNTIWRNEEPVALIDWDFAAPGSALDEIAQAAWYSIPLRPPPLWREAGFESEPDLRHRLQVYCREYGGISPGEILDALSGVQAHERSQIDTYGKAGIPPWDIFFKRGDLTRLDADREWLAMNRARLL